MQDAIILLILNLLVNLVYIIVPTPLYIRNAIACSYTICRSVIVISLMRIMASVSAVNKTRLTVTHKCLFRSCSWLRPAALRAFSSRPLSISGPWAETAFYPHLSGPARSAVLRLVQNVHTYMLYGFSCQYKNNKVVVECCWICIPAGLKEGRFQSRCSQSHPTLLSLHCAVKRR